jgi:hypothetical protein
LQKETTYIVDRAIPSGILFVVSSRLAVDRFGNPIVVLTSPHLGAATMYRVLGNGLEASTATEVGRFYFVGTPTGRRRAKGERMKTRRKWTEEHRTEARRLRDEGLSWSQIALQVCGDTSYKTTVGVWLSK